MAQWADLDELKLEVARDLGIDAANATEYEESLDDLKFQVAEKEGIPLKQGYNGDLKTKDAGAIGGQLGGPIGGHMVRRMIQMAEEELANQQ